MNKCNESVTGMPWMCRALDTVIGRAKTQIKGKFLFAVATLSFTRLGNMPEICQRDRIIVICLETKDCKPQLHNEMVYSEINSPVQNRDDKM